MVGLQVSDRGTLRPALGCTLLTGEPVHVAGQSDGGALVHLKSLGLRKDPRVNIDGLFRVAILKVTLRVLVVVLGIIGFVVLVLAVFFGVAWLA